MKGLGVTQILQQLDALAQDHLRKAADIERLKKNIINIMGAPGDDNSEQDKDILIDYCRRMFIKNTVTCEEAVKLFTNDPKNHLTALSAIMYHTPRGPDVIKIIKGFYDG